MEAQCIQHRIKNAVESRHAFLEGKETKVLPLNDFKRCVSSEMMVYNNLVKTKGEFEENWKASIKDTWLSKYLEN